MTKSLIFDTEATDVKNPVLIEAAWLELESISPYGTTSPFVQRYKPGKPISLGAMGVHHIMDEELVNCPASETFALPENVDYLIGHNIDFDWNVIGKPDIKRICTLALARKVWPDLDSYTQSALLYFLERPTARERLQNAHSALVDVGICSAILEHICAKLGVTSMEELWSQSQLARVPTVMPFGKHKGELISKLPADYKAWLQAQDSTDQYLKIALGKD